ncbi:unnamed protein product, partial [Brenthis ino]
MFRNVSEYWTHVGNKLNSRVAEPSYLYGALDDTDTGAPSQIEFSMSISSLTHPRRGVRLDASSHYRPWLLSNVTWTITLNRRDHAHKCDMNLNIIMFPAHYLIDALRSVPLEARYSAPQSDLFPAYYFSDALRSVPLEARYSAPQSDLFPAYYLSDAFRSVPLEARYSAPQSDLYPTHYLSDTLYFVSP